MYIFSHPQSLLAPKQTVLPEYKVAQMNKSRLIVLHYSTTKSIWDWFVLIATLYIAIVVPFNVAVNTQSNDMSHNEKHTVTQVLDILVELLFLFGKFPIHALLKPRLSPIIHQPSISIAQHSCVSCIDS